MTEPTTDTSPPLTPATRDCVFIVIPAYNEAERIGRTVAEMRAEYPQVVVVDDGSSDATAAAAATAGAQVLRHVINRGQGAALQTGIEYALRRGAGFVVTFDADGQHDVADVAGLLSPILRGECDITLGSRFLGGAEGLPRTRRALLRAAVLFTRLISRVRLTDTHNGLRAFSRRAAAKLDITLDRMAHASEIIDQIRRSGLPFREVPVRIRYTAYSLAKGQSARGALRILFDYLLRRFTE